MKILPKILLANLKEEENNIKSSVKTKEQYWW